MDENINNDRDAIYEIGYLILGSIAEENVPAEADKVKKVIIDAGATVIGEELPHHQQLSYTIRRKMVSGAYEKYDEAYFGWIKFEIGSSKIESIKKTIEVLPMVLRMLLITTVRENTYLGKHAPTAAAVAVPTLEEKNIVREPRHVTANNTDESALGVDATATPATAIPATVEEMDKSIDDMVKEA